MSHVEAITVGQTRITTVCEGFAAVALEGELPGSRVDWPHERGAYPWDFLGDGEWRWHVHAFLVETADGVVVVDTGLGEFPPFRPWTDQATDPWDGVDRSAVRHVILTHLHADHAGGSVVDGQPCFPNATYHLHTMDRLHFAESGEDDYVATHGMERLEELGMLETSFEDRRIVPGVRVLHSPGHTPGHRSVVVEDGGEGIVLTGDLFHQPTQVAFADHPSSHDLDVQLGVASRRLILWRAAQHGWDLGVPHFPEPFGSVLDGRWVARAALPADGVG